MLRWWMVCCFVFFSMPVSAQCWEDVEQFASADNVEVSLAVKLKNLVVSNPKCKLAGVSSTEHMVVFNRSQGDFWGFKITGVDIYNNSSPIVRNSMKNYFRIDWKHIGPVSEALFLSKAPAELMTLSEKNSQRKRPRKKLPVMKTGFSGEKGNIPLSDREKSFLRSSMPQRFRISFFRHYVK